MKSKEILGESPVTELPAEHQDLLANDFEKLAAESMKVAEALHTHNKKMYNTHWEELAYLMLRIQKQVAQFKK